MKKVPYFKIILVIILVLLCLAAIGSSFVNAGKYVTELEQRLSEQQIKMVTNGPVELKLLPWPHLNFRNITLGYKEAPLVEAAQANFYFNYFGKEAIDIKLINAEINGTLMRSFVSDHANNSSNYSVKLDNSSFVINNTKKLEKANGVIKFDPKDSVLLDLEGVYANTDTSIYLLLSHLNDADYLQTAKGKFTVPEVSLEFEGKGRTLLTAPELKGSLALSITPLYFSGLKSKKSGGTIVLNGNLTLDKELICDNITVNSPNITGLTGKVSITNKAFGNTQNSTESSGGLTNNVTFDFHIQTINLDEIFTGINIANDFRQALRYVLHNFSKTLYLDNCNVNFTVDKALIQKETFTDIQFIANGKDGNINMEKLSLNIPNLGSYISVDGTISHNKIRPKFQGKVAISSHNSKPLLHFLGYDTLAEMLSNNAEENRLLAKSNIDIIPHRLILREFKGIIGPYVLSGRSYIKENDDDSFRIHSAIKINEISLDKYKLNEKLKELFINLAIADLDKSGSYFFTLTDNFRWLRSIKGFYNLDIDIGKLTFNNYSYTNNHANFQLSPEIINIKDFSVHSEYANLKGAANLAIPYIKPQIKVEINAEKFDKKFFDAAMPNYANTVKEAYDRVAKIKEEEKSSAASASGNEPKPSGKEVKNNKGPEEGSTDLMDAIVAMQDNPKPELNLLGMHNVEGNIAISVGNLTWPNSNIKNFQGHLNIASGVLQLTDFNAYLEGNGTASITGSLLMLAAIPSAKIAFSFASIAPDNIMFLVLDEKNLLDGYFSLAGQFETNGVTYRDWVKHLSGYATFSGKNVSYKGFDMLTIIKLTAAHNIAYEQKLNIVKQSEMRGISYFDNISGKIRILSGISTIDDVKMDNIRLSGAFVCVYDLNTTATNARAKFSFYPPNSSIFITIPVTSTGNFKTRTTTFDNAELEKYFAKDLGGKVSSEQAAELLKSRKIK